MQRIIYLIGIPMIIIIAATPSFAGFFDFFQLDSPQQMHMPAPPPPPVQIVEETYPGEEPYNQIKSQKECLTFQQEADSYKEKADKKGVLSENYRNAEDNFRRLYDECMLNIKSKRAYPGYRLNVNQRRAVMPVMLPLPEAKPEPEHEIETQPEPSPQIPVEVQHED